MITRQFPLDISLTYPLDKEYDTDKIVFFDIETTGFTAESTYLYLIGCIYLKDSSLHMIQWFAEDIREEGQLISNFFEFIKNYKLLVHYNGSGFDIPYLTKKCELLNLDYSFKDIFSLDIYKKISPIKKIFKLKNYKQKTLEAFLNIEREDSFSGGELIEVYQSYLGKKQIEKLKNSRDLSANEIRTELAKLLHLLLLHNEDDLKGLVSICPILYYSYIFDKPFHIIQAGVDQGQLRIELEYDDFDLPVRIGFGTDCIYVNAYKNSALISIDTYEGELKYFYDNYHDYYYLPEEDRAVHKSLAIFVDKEYRKKAKPSTCYTKKEGLFIPLYHPIISPNFKMEYNDKISFAELNTDFLLNEENLTHYINHIFSHLLSAKL
ncbi:ribonuclease H-like domain-containing protein [Herbinix luporum]|uniref:ribonuclease H-like domain-containing protein n=1 Tax=Herbinix luporum TaxID=1679721 RepID=UPI00175F7E6D|nr:ribonuclease H-like domain-containing protein [Herbinix luporum]HHT57958.1 ribonuclease H-like domain-containing protein [Herbinix luporum]